MVRYRHYKGGIYELVCEATLESDPTVPRRIVTVWGVGYRYEPGPA